MAAEGARAERPQPGLNAPALAAMGAAMVSVQVGAAFAKGLFPRIGPEAATALRTALAALVLVAVFRPWRSPPARAAWPAIATYGVSLGLMNLTFYAALARIPLGLAVACEFVGPLAVAVGASRRPADLLWAGLAAIGLVALSPIGGLAPGLDLVGVALALGAGGFWGVYIVAGRRAGQAHGAQTPALGLVLAALVTAPAGLLRGHGDVASPGVLGTALAVALLSSVGPYTLEMFALTRIPVRVFGVLMSLEPVLAAAAGALILHEALSVRQAVAIAAVVAASVGVTATAGRPVPGSGLREVA